MDKFLIDYDAETGTWKEKKEPYCTIEIETEEDFEILQTAIKEYWERRKGEE